MSRMDDGAPTRAVVLEAARLIRRAHAEGRRCCWSCGEGCAGLVWAERVTATEARRPDAGRAVTLALRAAGH